MCSISGVIRFGTAPIQAEMLTQLMLSMENRGLDAAGVALVNNGKIEICKMDEPAWRFTSSRMYNTFLEEHLREDTKIALCHTRACTKGDPRDAVNNHPVFAGNCAVVHNGVVRNDDKIFATQKLERKAEVDTDVIRAIVDKYGLTSQAVDKLQELEGSVASIIVSNEEPEKVLLLRYSNPLIVAMSSDDLMFMASEKHAIHVAARPWVNRRGIWMKPVRAPLDWGTFPDGSAWLLGPEKLEWHRPFRLQKWTPPSQPNAKPEVVKPAAAAVQSWISYVECRRCEAWTKVDTSPETTDMDSLVCGKCGNLADMPEPVGGDFDGGRVIM